MDYQGLLKLIEEKITELWHKVREKIPVYWKFLKENPKVLKTVYSLLLSLKIILVLATIYILFYIVTPLLQELVISLKHANKTEKYFDYNDKQLASKIRKLEYNNSVLSKKLLRKTPQQPYLIVNSTINEFFLYKGKKLIREGKCSTGSYIMLQAADERKWIFQTPRGVFRIQGKISSPVWIKPDWAFIEEGLPVPSQNSYLRYEYGVLGDYAMSLGHGYLIHGTLYQRFLGMPVTHGCIRLGDDDLEAVYKNLDIGSKVFIY